MLHVYGYRAKARLHTGDLAAALADLTKYLEVRPDAEVHFQIGAIKEATREYEAAVDSYSKAIELKPNIITFYERRAVAYRALNKTDKAKADEKKVADLKKRQFKLPANIPNIF